MSHANEVRPIVDDELNEYIRCVGTAFHFSTEPTPEGVEHWRTIWKGDYSRRLAAFEGGHVRGTAGAFATDLTVPGTTTIPIAAVTAVTVLPTHRRRGLLTSMMRAQLEDAVERGELAAMLVAAEWPIYGRFGYGMAVETAHTIVDAEAAAFVDDKRAGTIEMVDRQGIRDLGPSILDAHAVTSPGAIARPSDMWDELTGVVANPREEIPKSRVRVVHRGPDGTPDGYAVYDPAGSWEGNRPRLRLEVLEFITSSDTAYRELWRYLCDVDWVVGVNARNRAVDEDLRPMLADGRAMRQIDRTDRMWVRLLDVRAALATRRYEVPVSCVIEVTDPFLDRGGRFELDGGPDGATCKKARRSPDVTMGVDVLGAAYLGGSPLLPYVVAGRIDERRAGAVAALDRALRTSRAPWATSSF